MSSELTKENLLAAEQVAFDNQTEERIAHGFVPDYRRLKTVEWFYNNVYREPELFRIHWGPRIEAILDRAEKQGGRVLEVGCGCGMLSLELARRGLDVVGLDLSPTSIAVSDRFKDENPYLEGFGSLQYICGDINATPFENESFETVVFFRSLHHMPEGAALLAKVARLLKKNGQIIISEPIRSHFNKNSAFFAGTLRLLLETWKPMNEKLGKTWSAGSWDQYVDQVFTEYTMEEEHEQSPLDNSIDSLEEILSLVGTHFEIQETRYSDAFTDKLVGGLRGEHRFEVAKFLRFLDDYMVAREILPPTSVELVGVKK